MTLSHQLVNILSIYRVQIYLNGKTTYEWWEKHLTQLFKAKLRVLWVWDLVITANNCTLNIEFISLCIALHCIIKLVLISVFLLLFFSYLASNLPRESIHQLLNAIVSENRSVEEELCVRQFISVNKEAVGHQWVPVVELAEFQSDTVPILEVWVKQQGGIKFQLQQVSTEVLHVLLNHDFYRLTWEKHAEAKRGRAEKLHIK